MRSASTPPAAADIVPSAFVGASSGVPLEELLTTIPIQAKAASAAGQFAEQIEREAQELLDGIMQTQIADAAREATAADLAARPRVTGYVRMLNPPSCARCVILAGKHYKWNAGFQRHPRCDCRHIPVDEDVSGEYRTDPDAYMRQIGPAERQRILGKAGAKAFDMGADLGQVVNARRGVSTAQVYGRDVRVTREGTTKRGLAGQRLGDLAKQRGDRYRRSKTPRLMPESIFQVAQDRDDALHGCSSAARLRPLDHPTAARHRGFPAWEQQ
jgi:hypothetical protein